MTEQETPLSEDQRIAAKHPGNMFLLACPGSGKTRTAAARIAHLVKQGKSVAACSYTNVGVEALRGALSTDHATIDTRNFVGTLHGLLLRHVTYPFGHLIHGATPRLLPEDSSRWPTVNLDGPQRRLGLAHFRMRPDGSMWVPKVPYNVGWTPEQVVAAGTTMAGDLKRNLARDGWVSFDDAIYIALRVLRQYPSIARAVAARYDEILVDEAQDTSELQIACLHVLARTGALKSLVIVGDLEQSISSYTGASPKACEALADDLQLERLQLSENHRSSQKICDLAAHFCTRPSPDRAVGPDAAHPIAPELLVYPKSEPYVAIEHFHKRLTELGEDPRQAAVLARKNSFCDKLNRTVPACTVDRRPFALGRTVAALRNCGTPSRHDVDQIDRIVALTAFGSEDLAARTPNERDDIRSATMMLLRDAPDLDQDLRSWIKSAAAHLSLAASTFASPPAKSGGLVLRTNKDQEKYRALDVFHYEHCDLRAQTVHDIKGESRDAILVVLEGGKGKQPQGELWAERVRTGYVAPEHAEEIRIAFVALTRPRRYCAIALPDNTGEEVLAAFESVGVNRLQPI